MRGMRERASGRRASPGEGRGRRLCPTASHPQWFRPLCGSGYAEALPAGPSATTPRATAWPAPSLDNASRSSRASPSKAPRAERRRDAFRQDDPATATPHATTPRGGRTPSRVGRIPESNAPTTRLGRPPGPPSPQQWARGRSSTPTDLQHLFSFPAFSVCD